VTDTCPSCDRLAATYRDLERSTSEQLDRKLRDLTRACDERDAARREVERLREVVRALVGDMGNSGSAKP